MKVVSSLDRHARILKILAQLQNGGGVDATTLSRQLGVCRRTVFRDLSLMRRAGIDVYFDDELQSYRLVPEEGAVVLPKLDADELTALVSAVHLSVLHGLPEYTDSLRKSTAKLLAQSSSSVRHAVSRLTDSCVVPRPHCSSPRALQVIHHVLQALRLRRSLAVTLVGSEETRFSPYRVIADPEGWQVTGKSSLHRDVRCLEPSEVTRVELTDHVYAVPRHYAVRAT
jgi:predicted DNA-binding transcriptional regulator YafY